MKIEDQVCSYKQGKEILNLVGWIDTGLVWYNGYVWVVSKEAYATTLFKPGHGVNRRTLSPDMNIVPAPTVAEFGVLLPKSIRYDGAVYHLEMTKPRSGGFFVEYSVNFSDLVSCFNENEAQARAEALLWLLESGYIKPDELTL